MLDLGLLRTWLPREARCLLGLVVPPNPPEQRHITAELSARDGGKGLGLSTGCPVEVRETRYLFGLGGHRQRRRHRLHGSGRHDCDAQGCQPASVSTTAAASRQTPRAEGRTSSQNGGRRARPCSEGETYEFPVPPSPPGVFPPLPRASPRATPLSWQQSGSRATGFRGSWSSRRAAGSSLSPPDTEAGAVTPDTGEMFYTTLRTLQPSVSLHRPVPSPSHPDFQGSLLWPLALETPSP